MKKGDLGKKLVQAHTEEQSERLKFVYVKGQKLAKREGYNNLDGIEAVQFYLMHKFHWLPSQVKSMSTDDLTFCLEEEDL